MNNETLDIFKGVTSKIDVNVKNSDTKKVQLAGRTLTAYLISGASNSNVLTRELTEIDGSKGQYQLTVLEGDSLDWDEGHYRLAITLIDENDDEQILFTDLGYGSGVEINVKSSPLNPFVSSIISDATTWGENGGKWYSSAYEADSKSGASDGLHTLALYMTDFTGQFWIQASLENSVPVNDTEWFDLKLDDVNDFLTYTSESALQNIDFIVNAQWVRFVYTPDVANTGTMNQALYRT